MVAIYLVTVFVASHSPMIHSILNTTVGDLGPIIRWPWPIASWPSLCHCSTATMMVDIMCDLCLSVSDLGLVGPALCTWPWHQGLACHFSVPIFAQPVTHPALHRSPFCSLQIQKKAFFLGEMAGFSEAGESLWRLLDFSHLEALSKVWCEFSCLTLGPLSFLYQCPSAQFQAVGPSLPNVHTNLLTA